MAEHATAPQWGVVIDEVRLFAAARTTGWWVLDLGRFQATGRVRYLAVTPSGSLLELGPFDRDDAEFVRDYLAEKLDRRVLKLRKWTQEPHLPKCRPAAPCRLCASTGEERAA